MLDAAVLDFEKTVKRGTLLVCRYVDDILILSLSVTTTASVRDVILNSAPELAFSIESPSEGRLQFLDLVLVSRPNLCWSYGKLKALKPLLPAHSSHSKHVKRGIVRSVMLSAVSKSCCHFCLPAITGQVQRLTSSGYSIGVIWNVLYSLMVTSTGPVCPKEFKRVAVVPYFHKVSHALKFLAAQFGVGVVFSNLFRLDRLTPFSSIQLGCTKAHRSKFVGCSSEVVYSIPLSCGSQYIGQTKRCINDRLREHRNNVERRKGGSELVLHLTDCNCAPLWSQSRVLHRERICAKRVFLEACAMASVGNAVSRPSVFLNNPLRSFVTGKCGAAMATG